MWHPHSNKNFTWLIHALYIDQVPFTRSSLNHNDVFILDTAFKIFLFSGCNSSSQERAKALEVVQYIKETKHSGKCDIATIGRMLSNFCHLFVNGVDISNLSCWLDAEDGKFVADPDAGEFWSLFGGYAPIPKDLPCNSLQLPECPATKLFWWVLIELTRCL